MPTSFDSDRTLVISGDIDEDTVQEVFEFITEMEETAEDGSAIIRICSDGGDAPGGLAIYDFIREATVKVVTEVYGEACSTAFLIFQAGHKRRIAPHARLMWHDTWDNIKGNYDIKDLDRKARDFRQQDRLANLALVERLCVPLSQIEEWSHAETYWTATDAINAGLADELTRKVNYE